MTTALPPFVVHNTQRISPLAALNHLTTFLETAANTAAYRPDSILSERGPVATAGGTDGGRIGGGNLILHHLNRVKLGIEGVRMGGVNIGEEVGEGDSEQGNAKKRKRGDLENALEDGIRRKTEKVAQKNHTQTLSKIDEDASGEEAGALVETVEDPTDEWEDKEDYELAQDEDEVDMTRDRDPAGGGGLEQPANAREAREMMQVEETEPGAEVIAPLPTPDAESWVVDKEERKRLKKLRRTAEKKKMEAKKDVKEKKRNKKRRNS